jgi:acyl-CoA thioesterase-1
MRKTASFVPLLVVLILALAMAGCARRQNTDTGPAPAPAPPPVAKELTPTVDRSGWPVIVALGDSLTAGYQLQAAESYPSQLQARLDELGYQYRVVNAGISGDTTTGALGRIESITRHDPEVVILILGGNDALRGQSVAQLRSNLGAMIEHLQRAGAEVVLGGMKAPPNLGPDYIGAFEQVYAELAEQYELVLVPFILEGVAAEQDLNLADGIHPNREGYAIITETVLGALRPILDK